MNVDRLTEALQTLGRLLERRAERHRLAVLGGGALLLQGLIDRPTRDLDVVGRVEGSEIVSADPLPPSLLEAVADVARPLDLARDWLNEGPASLLDLGLPAGFEERAELRVYGGLELLIADRFDQIHFKLYAATDLGPGSKHFADLRRLAPTARELDFAAAWCVTHDPSEAFASELRTAITELRADDGA